MIGNAHIDPVWLWPWQAGVDETLATCASAADRCEEYPQFIFTRGEAWVYRQLQTIAPDLFARIRALVARGQWHITGGQWIQPDVNLPTWDGLRRQIIHGRRYFRDQFGIEPDVGYNVDSFGHPATLPDLLASTGYIGYVFHRPNAKQTPLPAATFRWRGVGGGEVLGFRIPAAYTTRTDDLYGQIMLSLDAADQDLGHVMCFYGVGNHGGGPTKGNIEYILEHRHAFSGAELRFSSPQAFFHAVAPHRERLPVVNCELQRTFPGCYVIMQDMKRLQRHGEHRLTQAQHAIERLADDTSAPALHARVDRAWEDLLFTEFHDILAGTSVPQAWESVRDIQGRARHEAEQVLVEVTRRHARQHLTKVNYQQIVLCNPNDEPFTGHVQHEPFLDFDMWNDRRVTDEAGRAIPHQIVQAASTIMLSPGIVFPVTLAPHEIKVLHLRDASHPPATAPTTLRADTHELANAMVVLRVNAGGIEQLTFHSQPLLGDRGISMHLREDTADTWGFRIHGFDGAITDALADCAWIVEEAGPLRARLRADVSLGRSSLRWTLTLHHDSPVIDSEWTIHFDERFRLLQLPIHLSAEPRRWRRGLAGGAVTRDTDDAEWPLQGWAHPVPESGQPVLATVTQYLNSASLRDGRLTWSLLRATRMAWSGNEGSLHVGRDSFTDQGVHRAVMQLIPMVVNADSDAELHAAAARQARPLIVFDRYDGMARPPWGNNPPRRLWTAAEPRARADGRMLHLTDEAGSAVED